MQTIFQWVLSIDGSENLSKKGFVFIPYAANDLGHGKVTFGQQFGCGGTPLLFTDNIFDYLFVNEAVSVPLEAVRVEKVTPEGLCFATGINNRIWAVRGNTIFASALGEPSRWESFEGVASDSYQVAVDSSGAFTGVSVYDSNPIFFKEDKVYRLYGTIPSNFSLQRVDAPGVMEGCAESIQKINEVLYYKGRQGIYRYSGGIPQCISDNLGDLSGYGRAVAGADNRYYYISMVKEGDDFASPRALYVYDTQTGIWLKDQADPITSFARWGNVLYMGAVSGYIFSRELDTQKGLTVKNEGNAVEWFAQFKPFNETVKEKKVYSKLYFRMELEPKAYVTISVSHNGGRFEEVKTVHAANSEGVVTVPVCIKKCDTFTLRLQGQGGCTLKALVREYRTAGDR